MRKFKLAFSICLATITTRHIIPFLIFICCELVTSVTKIFD